MARVVVLVGAPGSGKSTIGALMSACLDVSERESLRRVRLREQGRHLSDDTSANATVWRAFRDYVVPAPRCDLVIDTDSTSAAKRSRW